MNRENLDNNAPNPNAAAWDMSNAPAFNSGENSPEESEEEKDSGRHERKVIAAFLNAEEGDAYDFRTMRRYDVEVPEGGRDKVLDMINDGTINEQTERSLLVAVAPAVALKGAETVLSQIDDYHEKKILAIITGGDFNNLATLGPDSLIDLQRSFPTAMEFEDKLAGLVEHIRNLNDDAKAAEYQAAGESLMQKVYGKQNEYWSELKKLNADAAAKLDAANSVETISGDAVYEPATEVNTGIFGNVVYESSAETSAEQQQAERQQRKIIAAFLTAQGGHINEQAIIDHDSTLPEGARDEVLDRINDGRIDQALQRDLLHSIQSPMDRDGAEAVRSQFRDKHEYRIAAWLSGVGFDNYNNLTPKSLEDLYVAYPTPLDFEYVLPQLVEHIRKYNGDDKAAEYQAAGETLMQKMYGKQCEYWKQIKVLIAEAEEKKEREAQTAKTKRLESNDELAMSAEVERSSEWEPGEVAYYQTSRTQAANGVVNREYIDRGLFAGETCEDSVMIRPDKQLFGVFDGAGGMGNGREASQFVAGAFAGLVENFEINNLQDLTDAVRLVHREMGKRNIQGYTTAVLSKLVGKEDGTYLAYASLGDSRLYVIHEDGTAEQITQDEGIENKITNAMSAEFGSLKQYGEVKLRHGDRVMMCSDGITGDRGADLMSDDEVARIVLNSANADEASKNLVANARKRDDRTAVVFGAF